MGSHETAASGCGAGSNCQKAYAGEDRDGKEEEETEQSIEKKKRCGRDESYTGGRRVRSIHQQLNRGNM